MEVATPSHFRRRLLVSLIVVALAFGLGHAALAKLKALKKEPERLAGGPPLPLVRAVELPPTDHREILRGYGMARAYRTAHIAAEVGGLVRAVSADLQVGTWVQPPKGDDGELPLVRIDREDLEDALSRLRAERAQALAEKARTEAEARNLRTQLDVSSRRLDTTKGELRRILSLVESKTLSDSEADRQRLAVFALEQIEAELVSRRDSANASIAVIEARIGLIDASERRALRDLDRTTVYAPYAGRVSARHVELGNLVAPGAPLFDLIDPTHVEVQIALPASRYGQVTAGSDGSHVVLRLGEGGGPVWEGTVVRVDPSIDADSRTFRAYVVLVDPDGTPPVAPGAHVVADVEGALYPNVLTLPREAFVEDRVFVIEMTEQDGVWIARERRPEVIAILSGLVVVRPDTATDDPKGVRANERVVTTNLEDIADGSRLRVLGAE